MMAILKLTMMNFVQVLPGVVVCLLGVLSKESVKPPENCCYLESFNFTVFFNCMETMIFNGVRLHYASIPIEKLHTGILVKRSPQSPFSQCIIFSDKIFGI